MSLRTATLALLFVFAAAGCEEGSPTEVVAATTDPVSECPNGSCEPGETNFSCPLDCAPDQPPAPPPPTPTPDPDPSCVRPANTSSVLETFPATCTAATSSIAPCLAVYSVSEEGGIVEVTWSFPGAVQPSSTAFTGTATYRNPGAKTWTSLVCTSTDPDDAADCCRSANGTLSFANG